MNYRNDNDDTFDLPPDLAELDRELSELSIQERPSFGPELLGELERAWEEGVPQETPSRRRHLIAAGIGALLVSMAAPQARASLARLIQLGPEPTPETMAVQTPEVETSEPELSPTELVAALAFDISLDDAIRAPAPIIPSRTEFDRVADSRSPEFDRERARGAILDEYPAALQAAGIGGTVDLRLYVGIDGNVENVQMTRSSGNQALDVAAMRVVNEDIRFTPGRRAGVPVGSWVDFPVVFEAADGPAPAEPAPMDDVPAPSDLTLPLPSDLTPGAYLTPPPVLFEAQQLLKQALGSSAENGGRWEGQLGALLTATPPASELPNTWRREASVALERALAADSDNPAPAFALARIRKMQGLPSEARRLLEEGIARSTGETPSQMVAEMHYELGLLIQAEWRDSAELGTLSHGAIERAMCEASPGLSQAARNEPASVADLLALNFVCPAELGNVMAQDFQPEAPRAGNTREDMIRAFGAAVEAEATHGGANVELLLDLADQRRWDDLLTEAQAFVWESQGHPHGLLLTGLALERLGRPELARERFELAVQSLETSEIEQLTDISMLLPEERLATLRALNGADRDRAKQSFWSALDPILITEVNERQIEHLARASYALLRFGAADGDAGRVWVRYGRPNSVRAFGETAGTRTEFWDYGNGPDLTFRRASGSVHRDLTDESARYLDDLLSQVPYWYNRVALRELRTLEGQVHRFRADRGSLELEITTRIPADLATGAQDEVELGVFMLDARGNRVSSTRRKYPALEQPLRLSSMVPTGARQVVVELFNPEVSIVTALRAPIPLADEEKGTQISDLFVLDPHDPGEDEVRRTAAWVQPNIGLVPEDGLVGVLFEMYEVEADEVYGLRVFLEDEGGLRRPVDFRPAGETGFRGVWRRSAEGAYRMTEYITVDLRSFQSGIYELIVEATLPGDGGEVMNSRQVRIR